MAKDRKIKSALGIIEEAVFILRRHSSRILHFYYIGSLPFVIAFLYFWADMSQSAFAGQRIITTSLGLTLLFIWMKCWHTVFCRKINSIVRLQPPPRWSLIRVLHLISSQSFFAGTGVILLPLAMVFTIPFGWVYAFYQNISMLDNGTRPIKEIIKRSWYSANLWPGQNHVILSLLTVFSLFILLNIGASLYILPVILKKLLGIDTIFTLSGGFSIFNTTFLTVSLGLTYLTIDPLIKTIYTLRSFYVFSVKSGDDIRIDLLGFKGTRAGLSCIIIIILFLIFIPGSDALEKTNNIGTSTEIIPADELDRSIERIAKKREYAWRFPKEKLDKNEDDLGTLERFAFWVADKFKFLTQYIKDQWNKIKGWFKKLFPNPDNNSSESVQWGNIIYISLYFFLALLLSILAVMIWRQFQRRRKPVPKIDGQGLASTSDLTDDYVNPVELPADRWLNMGYDLMKKQSLRLALRAFYLAILAHLADKNMITIARYKTNLDYISELQRRAHEYHDLINLFSVNVGVFDRTWYGMHEVTQTILQRFIDDQERMTNLVNG